MIGPIDAKPRSPKPSLIAERPASTELRPIANAMITGVDRTPVVTLPPSKAALASSGFTPAKCRVMAIAEAPVDAIGTGSFLPDNWHETYATADIIEYDGKISVKIGREFLLRKKDD